MKPDRPGYVTPYRKRHKPLTLALTIAQHEEIAGQAELFGLPTTTYATALFCGDCLEPIDIDDATEAIGVEPENEL